MFSGEGREGRRRESGGGRKYRGEWGEAGREGGRESGEGRKYRGEWGEAGREGGEGKRKLKRCYNPGQSIWYTLKICCFHYRPLSDDESGSFSQTWPSPLSPLYNAASRGTL